MLWDSGGEKKKTGAKGNSNKEFVLVKPWRGGPPPGCPTGLGLGGRHRVMGGSLLTQVPKLSLRLCERGITSFFFFPQITKKENLPDWLSSEGVYRALGTMNEEYVVLGLVEGLGTYQVYQ